MKIWLVRILILILFILFIIFYYNIADFTPKEDILLEKITKLEYKIKSITNKKDSIRTVIDSTHIKIITNEKHYQERINTIIVQSSDADSSYVSNYIRQHRNKRDSLNIH